MQFLRAHGAEFVVWNADRMNRTYSLSLFHQDVLEPPSSDPEDVKAWLEERFADLVRGKVRRGAGHRRWRHARWRSLVAEVPIVASLARRGVRLVLVHVLGPELADLDYLEEAFWPEEPAGAWRRP